MQHDRRVFSSAALGTAAALLLGLGTARADDTRANDAAKEKSAGTRVEALKNLKYRSIGPGAGGRCCRACGVPDDPLVYYLATANGGVWKSVDGGITWKPISDDQPFASAGSVAVAPSDPNVVYVGSGEANIRGNVASGNGIYKSTDAGKTWEHVWKHRGQIGTMTVHPHNPDIAFAAVLGHAFGPNPDRGVYRTTDGGKTWKRVLHKDNDTGASDVCIDPNNPRILFAGLWQARRKPWEMTSGGPGSGLYVSRDGGDTWKHLTGNGLPEGIVGKIGVRVAPSDSRRVYALIEADKGGLFRSDDGGEHWQLVNSERNIRQRAFYYTTLTVDPRNADVVWFPEVGQFKSIDGGKTLRFVMVGGDNHDIWINPKDPRHVINACDGGVNVSHDGGETWYSPQLPISQFYHVSADNRKPYHVSGAMQDLGTAQGPSDNLNFAGIARSDWHSVGGGEAGHTASDPDDPNIVYAGEYGGIITRYDNRTGEQRNVSVYPTQPVGHDAADLRYRFQWTAPILISPHDGKTVYHGGNVLFQTTDGGQHWQQISDDLTRNDRSKQKWSGGPITGDNTSVEYYCTIFALAESPKQKGLLWAGSDDGLVHVRREPGAKWENVTENIKGFPEWGTVDCIEASPHDAGTAYVVVDAHRLDDMRPYLFKTEDFGKTWKSLTANLPQDVYLHAVREDRKQKGLLFAGTETGVMFSTDDGETWQSLKLNLPAAVAVHDVVIKDNDLVVGTHGRSIYILDDITPIREMAKASAEDVHLFPTGPATRWHYRFSFPGPGYAGQNPPRGAVISYFLKKKPKGEVAIEILDAEGNQVARLSSVPERKENVATQEGFDFEAFFGGGGRTLLGTDAGVNRATWDLRYKGGLDIPGAQTFGGSVRTGPQALPGTYTVKLTADGKTQTGTLKVEMDPRVNVSEADLKEQLKMALAVRDDISRLSRTVRQIRAIKDQLKAREELIKEQPKGEELSKKAKELLDKFDALENKFHNARAKIPYDLLAQKGGAKLYSKYATLYGNVVNGDGAPTQGMETVNKECVEELQQHESEFKALVSGELNKFNDTAREAGFTFVIVPEEKAGQKKTSSGQEK